jgi:hypothetical protein
MMFNTPADTSDGWKLSIQGKCLEDSVYLFGELCQYLYQGNIPFKVASARRYGLDHQEQKYKALTIYVPNGTDHLELAEEVYIKIMSYSGWHDIKTPTSYEHYAGGVFYRNDRDIAGAYIPAN